MKLLLLLITLGGPCRIARKPTNLNVMEVSEIKERWLVIVNVFAASKKAGSIWKRSAAYMESEGISYEVRYTGGEDNATELARKACAAGFRRFVAVGGDGTVHDIINAIAGYADNNSVKLSEFTLAVIPLGSGNDWVKTFGISKNIRSAVRLLKAGRVARQDMVKVSLLDASGAETKTKYMVNVAGIGLDARVCEIVNRKKKQGYRGKKLYVSALFYCLKHRVPVAAKVVCDGQTVFEGKYLSMAFGTGKYSGGGMRQTPLAVPDDGLIDVTIIPDIPMSVIARKVVTLFTGTFHTVKELTLARCAEVEVVPFVQSDKEPLEVDGEVVGRVPARFKVLEDQLNVMVP